MTLSIGTLNLPRLASTSSSPTCVDAKPAWQTMLPQQQSHFIGSGDFSDGSPIRAVTIAAQDCGRARFSAANEADLRFVEVSADFGELSP